MAVIQIVVLTECLDFETAVTTKKDVTCSDEDILVAERDATQTAVTAAALEINLALVQVEELLNSLLVKINRKHAAVTLSLLTATHDRCCDKFW